MQQNDINTVIETIVNMSAVKRYHGHFTLNTQTDADHSGRVAQLAFFVALEFYKGDVAKASQVAMFGLFHDLPESILHCDVNGPIKNRFGIGVAIKKLETHVINNLFEDQFLRDLCLENAPDDDFNLMKMCDLLDFGFYVRTEIAMGNSLMLVDMDAFKREIMKFPEDMLNLEFTKACVSKILSVKPWDGK